MSAIKGFDTNLKCRDFQFEIGKTYEHDGAVKACDSGFHAIGAEGHPLEVFRYYPPAGSRYCEVEQAGETHSDDGIKIASAKITISAEISLSDLTGRAVEWVFKRAKKVKGSHCTDDYGAASATGTRGAASATGTYGAASATGYRGAASATGDHGAASATGTWGAASATGDHGAAMACGYEGMVMGALERDSSYRNVSVASAIVGKKGVKANTWYRCKGGKLVAA